ncbi:MAG: VIT domain-containing protein [Actinobacteria bacterium]|nr:VIT domain-containing protein [Actinomycetota bacterium]
MTITTYKEQELPGISLTTGDTEFPVTAIDINGSVDGDGVIWTVEATFENPLDTPAEAVFTLPLPVGGAVKGMTMKIGDREVAAEIKEREAARIEYEEAKEQGHSAAIVEQERAEIFTITVGNIHPGEAISVVLEIHDRAAIDGTKASLRFPTMIKKRYTPAGVPDVSTITPPRRTGRSPLRATVAISFSEPAKDLICETVPSAQITPTHVSINDFGLTGDIILHWTIPAAIARAKWVADASDPTMGTLEVNIRVEKDKTSVRRRKAVQIMFDRSGSMSDHYIEWARRITEDLIASLTDEDLIHILTFDSSIDAFDATSHGFVPVSRTVKQQLQKELAMITARGGTDLTGAITTSGAALATLADRDDDADIDRIAVLITDGAYGDEATAVHHREKHLAGARVIAVAIGENANGFLETLAANGVCTYVSSPEGLAEASAKVMSRVATAAHSKARLEAKGLANQAPAHAPDIYPETIVTLSGRMPRPQPGDEVVVNADSGHVVTLPIAISTDGSVTTRWASQHIKSLDYEMMSSDFSGDVVSDREKLEALIVEMSVKYKVLSKYTAWLAIDRSRTTDQVIVRTLVQPVYEAFDSFAGAVLFQSALIVDRSSSIRPLVVNSMARDSMDSFSDSSGFISFGRKLGLDMLNTLIPYLEAMLETLANGGSIDPDQWVELNDAIDYWLGEVKPTALGVRTFNKIKNRMVKVQESEQSSAKAQAKAARNLIAVITESQNAAGSRNSWTEDF